jgi:hypothetical protein
VDYNNPRLQKGLSNLQLLDNIIGAADRHPGNFMYQTNQNNEIIGVQGIDNDDAFGPIWNPEVKIEDQALTKAFKFSKTPGVPPVIDVDAAISVLQKSEEDLKKALNLLPSDDVQAAVARLKTVQDAVIDRIAAGQLASENGELTQKQVDGLIKGLESRWLPKDKTNILIETLKLPLKTQRENRRVLTWGTKVVTDMHRSKPVGNPDILETPPKLHISPQYNYKTIIEKIEKIEKQRPNASFSRLDNSYLGNVLARLESEKDKTIIP